MGIWSPWGRIFKTSLSLKTNLVSPLFFCQVPESDFASFPSSAEKLVGYSAAEVIGQPITVIVPPERIAEEEEVLRRLRAGGSD